MAYSVEYKVVGIWKNGRYYPNAILHEKTKWKRFRNRGILKGAKSFKENLKAIYGKNLKVVRVKRIKVPRF